MKNNYLNLRKYHISGQGNTYHPQRNAIVINTHNSVKHELAKCLGAIMLKKFGDIKFNDEISLGLDLIERGIRYSKLELNKNNQHDFITEACPNDEPERRIDLVDVSTDTRFEFESDKRIRKEKCITVYL